MLNKATQAILTNKNEIIEEYSFQLVIIHVFKDVTPNFRPDFENLGLFKKSTAYSMRHTPKKSSMLSRCRSTGKPSKKL